jgi:hypothetical protein
MMPRPTHALPPPNPRRTAISHYARAGSFVLWSFRKKLTAANKGAANKSMAAKYEILRIATDAKCSGGKLAVKMEPKYTQ